MARKILIFILNEYIFDHSHVPEIAKMTDEAVFPDGEHILRFHAEDAAGRIDRAQTGSDAGRDVNAKLKVIVDNFRPYVKDAKISSGAFPIYSSAWNWNTTTHELKLRPNAADEKADMGQPLHITMKTSEPMKLTTDADGQPDGSMKIKLFARDPNDPNRIKVYLDWYDEANPTQNTASRPWSVNEDGTEWNFFVPHAQYANLTGGFENYTQFVHITGTDLAGTDVIEYDGSQTTFGENQIPSRDPNNPQTWVNPVTGFGNISGVDTVHRFLFGNFSAFQPFLATYGEPGTTDYLAAVQPVYRFENGERVEDGSIVAGWSESFDDAEDAWLLRLADDGAPLWQYRYGTSAQERATAIQQAFRDENGETLTDGFLVAGQRTDGTNDTDVLVFQPLPAGRAAAAAVRARVS